MAIIYEYTLYNRAEPPHHQANSHLVYTLEKIYTQFHFIKSQLIKQCH